MCINTSQSFLGLANQLASSLGPQGGMLSDLNLVTLFVDGRKPLLPSTHNTAQHVAHRPFLLGGRLRVCLSETSPMERPVNQGVDCPVWSYAFYKPPTSWAACFSVCSFFSFNSYTSQGAGCASSTEHCCGFWFFLVLCSVVANIIWTTVAQGKKTTRHFIHTYICMYARLALQHQPSPLAT